MEEHAALRAPRVALERKHSATFKQAALSR